MARYSRALLPLLLLAGALVQGSYCSRPSPGEPQKLAVLPDPVVRGAAEPRPRDRPTTQVRRPVEEEAAGVHHGANADGATAASALDDGGAVGLEQRKEGAPVSQQVLGGMPGSKMAPQVLGGEVEDSMARPSCRSSDGHVTCAPSPPH
ncbi:hypothetical protein ACQ4PT_042261 [Festuca glaucescens]